MLNTRREPGDSLASYEDEQEVESGRPALFEVNKIHLQLKLNNYSSFVCSFIFSLDIY